MAVQSDSKQTSSDESSRLLADQNDAYEMFSFETDYGTMEVTVEGDLNKPAIFTYHDIGLNHHSCFQSFLNCAGSGSMFSKFCIVHIDAPGQQYDASEISQDIPELSMEILADQIEEVRARLRIQKFIGFGVGAGAYILCLYAINHPECVKGLILVGLTPGKCRWMELTHNWMGGFLKHVNYDSYWKTTLLDRYFSQRSNPDLRLFHHRELDKINHKNMQKFIYGFTNRKDITEDLAKIKSQNLLLIGEDSEFLNDTVISQSKLDRFKTDWLQLDNSNLLLTEECPQLILEPITLFFQSMGYFLQKKKFTKRTSSETAAAGSAGVGL